MNKESMNENTTPTHATAIITALFLSSALSASILYFNRIRFHIVRFQLFVWHYSLPESEH